MISLLHIPNLTGIVHVFIKHTSECSVSLTINENADPSVRVDFETHFNKMVSESDDHYTHTLEGKDDMTSHIKSSILGSSVSFQSEMCCNQNGFTKEKKMVMDIPHI